MQLINEQISSKIIDHTRMLSKYNAVLRKILPPECLNHVEVANIRNQNLMLITDSPVWTTKLRQLSPQILQALRADPVKSEQQTDIIHHVQISTRYKYSHHDTSNMPYSEAIEAKTRPTISQHTAEMLSQSADSINHPQLKTSLLKIAAHAAISTANKQKK